MKIPISSSTFFESLPSSIPNNQDKNSGLNLLWNKFQRIFSPLSKNVSISVTNTCAIFKFQNPTEKRLHFKNSIGILILPCSNYRFKAISNMASYKYYKPDDMTPFDNITIILQSQSAYPFRVINDCYVDTNIYPYRIQPRTENEWFISLISSLFSCFIHSFLFSA